jgi:hypothetical protein
MLISKQSAKFISGYSSLSAQSKAVRPLMSINTGTVHGIFPFSNLPLVTVNISYKLAKET